MTKRGVRNTRVDGPNYVRHIDDPFSLYYTWCCRIRGGLNRIADGEDESAEDVCKSCVKAKSKKP